MIQIKLNGEKKTFDGSLSITSLLDELAIDTKKIALECNREIISKSCYDTTHIANGDVIEIIAFVGGG